jgi:hypothetical protein
MTVIQMSDRELTRLRVMIDLTDGRLTPEAAATLMGIGRRQLFRLRRSFASDGPSALVSRKRGRPSNRKRGETFQRTVLTLVREHYPDFGPTLAAEKLAERHGLRVGVETLRQWMMADGQWIDRRHRLPSPHQPRRRRECLGELVQIDGSEHAWFENRGEMCTLLAFVDDATSRLMQLRFVASESAFDYFRATRGYLETHGKPVALYSDKHGIFRVNSKDAAGGDRITQFGRALSELNIDIICANSPQAKGRVERAFGTLQDRLVKELRLAGISTVATANAWLPGYMAAHNGRFARGLVRKKVDVVNYPDGRFAVQFEGTPLPFQVFDKIQTVEAGAIVENKRLGAVLALVKEQQAAFAPHQRRRDPRRQRPPNNLEAPGLPTKGRPSRRDTAAPPS